MDHDRDNNGRDRWIARARHGLEMRRGQKPVKKAGQLRALWREVESALGEGQSLDSIRNQLENEGLVLTTATLRSYISRLRRKRRADAARRFLEAAIGAPTSSPIATKVSTQTEAAKVPAAKEPGQHDASPGPLVQAREVLAKRRFDIRKIHGDGDPSDRNLF
jgi:hypothetical protein